MSDSFLVRHALKNVWCDPKQDFEFIFEPDRITDANGVIGSFDLLGRTIYLPDQTSRYHVYQIGQSYPATLGLLAPVSLWATLATVAQQKKTYIQVYTNEGLLFPLSESYIMFTRNRTLLLAVKEQPTIAPLKTTPLYFRFYSNAYFYSRRSDSSTNAIQVGFYRHTTTQAALAFQYAFTQASQKTGYVSLSLNGNTVGGILPSSLTVGDVLEFVYDSSVKKVVDFPISGLQTFDSTLDLKRKYLLHYAGDQVNGPTIDYRDDCDVWLFKTTTGVPSNPFNGVYFHKNQNDAFRQVTHRDYSVTVPYVDAYLNSQPTWGDITQLTLRLVIRNAGYQRTLVFEAHDIHELYKLPEQEIVNAFLGIDSTVDVWRAPSLEASPYITVMDSAQTGVTLPVVESAYGYNAISQILGDSPLLTPPAGSYLYLPPVLRTNSTIYEYDAEGLLLGHYPHIAGSQYAPVYQGTGLIEGIVGTGGLQLDMAMGQNNVPIDPTLSYRFYIAPLLDGQPNNAAWQDVTGDTSKVNIVNGVAVWNVDAALFMTCVKSDKNFLAYDVTLSPSNGLMQFSVNAGVSYPTGVVNEVLSIPVGQLDLWFNNKALVENIDYYVDWPQVVLVNKAFLNDGLEQTITVRGTGFCNSDMSRTVAEETNFVQWGVLSHNDRFNIRDDKVIRIIANGRTFHRSQVEFSEDQIQASIPGVPNGSPYQVQDVVVPLRGFTDQDTYALKALSDPIDVAVSNYLTLKLPDQTPGDVDIIPEKYPVYSPFFSTIIHDVINGEISMTPFKEQYSDVDVKNALTQYTYLLQYDPTQRGANTLFVDIQPHSYTTSVELDIYQYLFVSRVNHIYFDGELDLSSWVSISQDGL